MMRGLIRWSCIALLTLVAASGAHAQFDEANWRDATGEVSVREGLGFFVLSLRGFAADVIVTNTSGQPLTGGLRLVLTAANKTVTNADGTTGEGKPYLLFAVEDEILEPGQWVDVQVHFGFMPPGPLSYATRVERHVPPTAVPVIGVGPTSLDFGDVFVGTSADRVFQVSNSGTANLSVTDMAAAPGPWSVFPPTSFELPPGATPRTVSVGFTPDGTGPFSATAQVASNDPDQPVVQVGLTGNGVTTVAPGDIDAAPSLEFGVVADGQTVQRGLTVRNTGQGPLAVSGFSLDQSAFALPDTTLNRFPFTLAPGESRNLSLDFTPPPGSAGQTIAGGLDLSSDDPDENPKRVRLSGQTAVAVALDDVPLVAARVFDAPRVLFDFIDNLNCAATVVQVQFSAAAQSADFYRVLLIDQTGSEVGGSLRPVPQGVALETVSVGDTCTTLVDGVVQVRVEVFRDRPLNPFSGIPAAKSTSALSPPVLDPVGAITTLPNVEVCGSSRERTLVRIEGGAQTVSTAVAAGETRFCLAVPLRPNSQNTLLASATENAPGAPPPLAVASAPPVQVVQLNPDEIFIAEASSRPLSTEEIEQLVQEGVIDLDDPDNFNVSLFNIVLTVGGTRVTLSQPVAVPVGPGVAFGGGGSFGGGSGGGGGGGTIIVIRTPSGQTIPGMIVIDGRIKTLKEFFQVTLALHNTSGGFTLSNTSAEIQLPGGLTPVRASPGFDVDEINLDDAVDRVDMGNIPPGNTGNAQFIIRGDQIGNHSLDVDFSGLITGGGLPQPFPFSGSATTSVEVYGPPELDVVVRHPSREGAPDVVVGEIYPLTVEITNRSVVPALYTSLDLMVGAGALLVDAAGTPIAGAMDTRQLGHVQPGQTVSATFLVQSLVEGEIIACQAVSSENINLTVDTGPDGVGCNVANTIPSPIQPPLAGAPPTVMAVSPPNGQGDVPPATSVFASLTPGSACLRGDTFGNVETAPIDPGDPGLGDQVVAWTLDQPGTFHVEQMNAAGQPVRHVPTELTLVDNDAPSTTVATLTLGLSAPPTQYFLLPDTCYRATLVGADIDPTGAVCNAATGAKLATSYRWTFCTEPSCQGAPAPLVSLLQPPDGSTDRPLNQVIELAFSNPMDAGTLTVDPVNPLDGSLAVLEGAVESGGELLPGSGRPVPGSAVFDADQQRLRFTPDSALTPDETVHIRLTDALRDVCGNPLQTPANGVQLYRFGVEPPDTTPPPTPSVDPVPPLTNAATLVVTGHTEPGALVTVEGGQAPASEAASTESGLFGVEVSLKPDATNSLAVTASDAAGNTSPPTTVDTEGNPLLVVSDRTPPAPTSLSPQDGALDVAVDVVVRVVFDQPIDPATVNHQNVVLEGSTVPGSLAMDGDAAFTFTPDADLGFGHAYTLRLPAGGIRDLAGNGLADEVTAGFTTEALPPPVIDGVEPASATQGDGLSVTFTGTNLATASALTSANPGISGSITAAGDTEVTAEVQVELTAPAGATTLELVTDGGSTSIAFTVDPVPAPTLTGLAPNTGVQGTGLQVVFTGTHLATADALVSANPDISGSIDSATETEVVATIGIALLAPTGATTMGLTTAGGSASLPFTVLHRPPLITAIVPSGAIQGQTLEARIEGSGLGAVTAISVSGSGVTVTDLGAVGDTRRDVEFQVSPDAESGQRDVLVTSPGGSASGSFEVIAAVTPPDLLESLSREVSVYRGTGGGGGPAAELLESVSREVSVYRGPQGGGGDPVAELLESMSREVSVYRGAMGGGGDPVADLLQSVSRAVSVYRGPRDGGGDPAVDLLETLSRTLSVRRSDE